MKSYACNIHVSICMHIDPNMPVISVACPLGGGGALYIELLYEVYVLFVKNRNDSNYHVECNSDHDLFKKTHNYYC